MTLSLQQALLWATWITLCCYQLGQVEAWVPLVSCHESRSTMFKPSNQRWRQCRPFANRGETGLWFPQRHHNNNHLIERRLSIDDTNDIMSSSTPIVLLVALVLLVAAQGFINQLASGDQGLGAYLKDGSGYNKSAYKPNTTNKDVTSDDPLPWLSLPKLDFVDVAGQDSNEDVALQQELEEIRQEMNDCLQQGRIEQATLLRDKLQSLMEQSGFQYEADNS